MTYFGIGIIFSVLCFLYLLKDIWKTGVSTGDWLYVIVFIALTSIMVTVAWPPILIWLIWVWWQKE